MATEDKSNAIKQNGVSKRARRRARKKAQKRKLKHEEKKIIEKLKKLKEKEDSSDKKEEEKVEYVGGDEELAKISESRPEYREFQDIFSKFSTPAELMKVEESNSKKEDAGKNENDGATDPTEALVQEAATKKLSAKQRRRLGRLSIAELNSSFLDRMLLAFMIVTRMTLSCWCT